MGFKLKFWGVRGSIACPSTKFSMFGGNTSCIEVSCGGQRIILDCGTGIRNLGHWMMKKGVRQADILMSHTHWDHIQGLPMFSPLFVPGNKVTIHGAMDIVSQTSIKEVLSRQMEHAYFPVKETELAAELDYVDLNEGDCIDCGKIKVTNL